jgi:hypothetical protein
MKSNQSRRRPPPLKAARRLIRDGFAVCRIEPGEKRPTYPYWATGSIDPDTLSPDDNIGIICGPLCGFEGMALVCADVDSRKAVELADKDLPATKMVDGRPGKLRSHRYYLTPLASVGAEHTSTAAQTSPVMLREFGHAGPRTVRFKAEDKSEIVALLGTGAQGVCPPSMHASGERREWDGGRRGEPAVVPFPKLLLAAEALATACGWKPRGETTAADEYDPTDLDAETPDVSVTLFMAYRIDRYLDELPASVSGQGGHDACYRAACVLVWGFALGEADALKFVMRFNSRCNPKWSERELRHKLREAATATNHQKPRGYLLASKGHAPPSLPKGTPSVIRSAFTARVEKIAAYKVEANKRRAHQ